MRPLRPMCWSVDGSTLVWTLVSTLLVGGSGTGKTNSLLCLCLSLNELLLSGDVELAIADPKSAELSELAPRTRRAETEPELIANLLEDLVREMKERQTLRRSSPVVVCVVDEYADLAYAMPDSKLRGRLQMALFRLLSQGRSAGIFVVAAAIAPQKELMGATRGLFPSRVAHRLESEEEAVLMFGRAAVHAGAHPHAIPVASAANGYRSAGLAYLTVPTHPFPLEVRFPRVDEADIQRFCARIEAEQ